MSTTLSAQETKLDKATNSDNEGNKSVRKKNG
jgi:hypothetical protein